MPTKQFLISGTSLDPSTSATEYSSLLGDGNVDWHAVEASRESIIPTPGKLTNFQVGVRVAPGNGKSWTFTIRLNGTTDTALSVTISDAAVLSSLDTDEVVVAAGDKVCIKAVGTGTPAAAAALHWTCQFTPDTDGETILLANDAGVNLTTNYYNTLIGAKVPDDVEFEAQTLFPTVGTSKKFYVELGTAPGNGNSRVFTIRKNGEDTGLVVTISNTDTTGNDTDPAHNVAIAAGDKVTIINTVGGTPASSPAKFGICFLPDTQGEYIASATTDNVTSSSGVEYQVINCGDSYLTATEAEQHGLAQVTTAKKIYVNLGTAPGAGSSWIFTLREALGDTALTVTISNTDTSGNAATDEAIAADALVDTSIDATAGALTSKTQIAYLFYNAPSTVVTPATLALTLTEYAPILKEVLTPTTLSLTTTTYIPVLKEVTTPSTLSLTTTGYAPILKETLTPSTLSLSTTGYAPVLREVLTPTTLSIILTAYAPVLNTGIIVGLLELVLTGYAPTLGEEVPFRHAWGIIFG